MNNFDDLFSAPAEKNAQSDRPFDKDAWAEKKQAQRQQVYDMADSTAEAVAADGGKFRDYLGGAEPLRPLYGHQCPADPGTEAGGHPASGF